MFGGVITSDNGMVASSDYPGFMKHESVSTFSRTGNVNTFFTTSPTYPLVFIVPAGTDAVGLLAIRAASGGYYVDVLCDGSCSILVFRAIDGAASGYGLAFYNTNGVLTYSSEKDMLAANSLVSMAEGISVGVVGNAVSYSAARLSCQKTNTAEYPQIDYWAYQTGHYESRYQCQTENQYQCTTGEDGSTICQFVPVEVCGFVQVWVPETAYQPIYADVTKTDWAIYRGAVFFSGGTLNFRWVLHKSGFYRTLNGITDAPGYTKPTPDAFYASQWGEHNGAIASGGSFPYTTQTYNGVTTHAATLRNSDYV